jgi:hypothetical protein
MAHVLRGFSGDEGPLLPRCSGRPRAALTLALVLLAVRVAAGAAGEPAGAPGAGGPGPDPWQADRPPYTTAGELCRYVNAARERSRGHERWRGVPGRGSYHDLRTWPPVFTGSPDLDRLAAAEAERVARGGAPAGSVHVDSSWRRPLWVAGIGTERIQVTARDEPGDWHPARAARRAALVNSNGAARMALYYQDPGGEGPVLGQVGCGGASTADGRARVWVVILGE